jgi:hypothetical protein
MPEPNLLLLLTQMSIDVLLSVLKHSLAMENLLTFLLQALGLPLLFREQVLDVDRNVDLDVSSHLGSTDTCSLTLRTGKTSAVVSMLTCMIDRHVITCQC